MKNKRFCNRPVTNTKIIRNETTILNFDGQGGLRYCGVSNSLCGLAAIAFLGFTATDCLAQSIEAFETLPILPSNAPSLSVKEPVPYLAPPIELKQEVSPYKPAQYSIQYQAQIDANANSIGVNNQKTSDYLIKSPESKDTVYAIAPSKGPLRMVYYRVPMNVIALDQKKSVKSQPVTTPAKPKAKTVWDYFKSPQNTIKGGRVRGPWRAIYEDTKSAIKNDVPQAIADYLPWVDYERKQVPFNEVLGKVANGLDRAYQEDPEWAASLKPELMDLARKMDAMPSPPQYKAEYAVEEIDQASPSKSFKKRPVWPGAKFANEEQIRPFALTSQTENEIGGASEVLPANYQIDNFDDAPQAPKMKSSKKPSKKKNK